jgi:hypothetical protein
VQEVAFAADQVSTAVSPSVVLLGLTAIVTLVLPPPLLLLLVPLLLLLVPLLLVLLPLLLALVLLLVLPPPPQPDTTTADRATIAE